MNRVKWAILATGSIARRFAEGLKKSETGELVSVGSRTLETATAFCEKYGGKPFGSYAEAIEDCDAVYIATPHHLHEKWTILCADAGKAILCEKPFTLDFPSAERAISAVRQNGVFFMEAFMYRCHPQVQRIVELVNSGVIGQFQHVSSEFGFAAGADWKNFRTVRELGGGALMDVGTYCVSMTLLLTGIEPHRVEYSIHRSPAGYDSFGAGLMEFPQGITADFRTAIHHSLPNKVTLYGELGRIIVEEPWFSEGRIQVILKDGREETLEAMGAPDMYALEADAVARYMDAKECPFMPINHTLMLSKTLDRLKKSAGLDFGQVPPDMV